MSVFNLTPATNTRTRNESAVLLELLRHKHVSRVRLAELTDLSATTITKIINNFLQAGLVEEDQATLLRASSEGAGRPRTALRLIPQARYAVGVYLRMGEVQIGITDLRAQVLHTVTMPFDVELSPEAALAQVAKRILRELAEQDIALDRVMGVGFGLNGSVDPLTGVNYYAPGLEWHDVPTYDILAAHLPLPVCADNNVRLMAIGEAFFGDYQQYKNMALVYVHYGLGSGLVIDGQILRGAYAAAGQISEMTVITDVDSNCFHSEIRDLGSLLTEPNLIRDGLTVAEANGQTELAAYLASDAVDKLECFFDEAQAGNEAIKAFLHERATYLGIGLANLINLLNPELILLAGNIYSKGHAVMLEPTQAAMNRWAFSDLGQRVKLAVVPLGRPIGVIGAAAFALDSFFYRQGGGEVMGR